MRLVDFEKKWNKIERETYLPLTESMSSPAAASPCSCMPPCAHVTDNQSVTKQTILFFLCLLRLLDHWQTTAKQGFARRSITNVIAHIP
jgi:hypothetical protein